MDFAADYDSNDLAKELISVYNTAVSDTQSFYDIDEKPYFTGRLTEAQIAEERAEAEALGEARGRAKAKARRRAEAKAEAKAEAMVEAANHMADLINKGHSVETALKMVLEESSESYPIQ